MTANEEAYEDTFEKSARVALELARNHLLSLQSPKGWWKGDLETNVTMDAEDLLLREFMGVRNESDTRAAATWIRKNQRDDGTWATYFGGPGDLSTTVEAYVALRLAGDSPTDVHMEMAAAFIRESGGIEAARVFTRIWLALFGLWSWEDLPAIPPEVMFLPSWFPLNIYEFGCWARQTLVPLTIIASYRPLRPIGFGIEELRSGRTPEAPRLGLSNWKSRFALIDAALRRYERIARQPIVGATIRRAALYAAERWVIRRQESDGSWGGIQPPWVYSLLALHLRGYPLDHPVIETSFRGIEQFIIRRDDQRWLEACQSPVWDTALATIALSDAGLEPSHEALQRAGDWLIGEEVLVQGDWAIRRPDLAAGGWAFEFANSNYPDVDDTAEVILALRRIEPRDPRDADAAVTRAIAWTEGMVSKEGAWGAFDANNIRDILYELPFCDFGAVIDPPSADVTAHVVEMLASEEEADADLLLGGVDWLRRAQESDGSWFGRWGVNYTYGTGAVVPALVKAGTSTSDPMIRRAVEFLESHQNSDGGWGEDIRSYDDPRFAGRGNSTASQTGWSLLALISAGERESKSCERGIAFLVETQREDGSWDEPFYTGTGFPGDFYINYHLYRLVFPLSALGRYLLGSDNQRSAAVQVKETSGGAISFEAHRRERADA